MSLGFCSSVVVVVFVFGFFVFCFVAVCVALCVPAKKINEAIYFSAFKVGEIQRASCRRASAIGYSGSYSIFMIIPIASGFDAKNLNNENRVITSV